MKTTTTVTTNISTVDLGEIRNQYLYNKLNDLRKEVECYNGVIIDDHTNEEKKLDGLVILGNGAICATFQKTSRYWSLNELYKDRRGQYHVSRRSVGGTMKNCGRRSVDGTMKNCGSLEDCVEKYNSEYAESIKQSPNMLNLYFGYMVEGFVEF